MQSLWSKTTELSNRKKLKGDIQVQNVVIGAGMAGILIAYFLKNKGLEVLVVEAEQIAGGQVRIPSVAKWRERQKDILI